MTRREVLLALGAAPLAKLAAANERINVGFIGVGGQGMDRVRGFLRHPDVQPVAVCDLDTGHVANALAYMKQQRNASPETFGDYRKLLAIKDLDAVCIATPDHWHALPALE